MSMQSKRSTWSQVVKKVMLFVVPMTLFYAGYASADAANISVVATTLTSTFGALAKLVTATSYVVGMGFGVSSMLKFKAHKDNPQGTPLGVPMMLLFVAAGLIFLPSIFTMAGGSLGVSAAAGVGGVSSFTMP